MIQIKQLDEILRGDATRRSALEKGQLDLPVGGLSVMVFVLGAVSGLCTGSFALFRALWSDIGTMQDAAMQIFASAVKLPFLFFLTLLVTFPSLYVFSALAGSRLSFASIWRLLLAMIIVMLTVLASLGPIVVFFGVSTESYAFMKLLNVASATVAGSLGLAFLLRTLHRLVLAQSPESNREGHSEQTSVGEKTESAPNDETDGSTNELETDEGQLGPLDRIGSTPMRARVIFQVWLIVFAVVGAQMSWVLRPFIGAPDMPFAWFRDRQSNFFLDVARTFSELFGG